jgi:hypothetical protein
MPPKGSKYTKKPYSARQTMAAKKIQAVVRKAIANNNRKTLEVKQAVSTTSDGTEILHNNFITLDAHLLETTQGVKDPMTSHTECRIGDQITLRGCKLKLMVELNSRYSDATFRLFVVKCAKGDSPTRATLFTGLSGNKMLDTINKERYTVIFQKYFKIKAGNQGISNSSGTQAEVGTTLPPSNAGIQYVGNSDARVISRSTKIIKAWIPGKAFAKNGVIQYENAGTQVKFHDYQVLLYAYSNYGTDQDVWNVGRCNDYINQLYFTDA